MIPVVPPILQLTVGAICVWAGAEKVRQLDGFAAGIEGYRLLPLEWVRAAGTVIVVAELTIGTSLLTNIAPLAGAFGAALLFAAFTAALTANLIRGNLVPCNCFGPSSTEVISKLTLVRSAVLLALAVGTVAFTSMRLPWPGWETEVMAAMIAVLITMLLRTVDTLPVSWAFLTARAPQPRPSHVLTWKDARMNVSLRRQGLTSGESRE